MMKELEEGIIVVDDFFLDYSDVRKHVTGLSYAGEVNPVDNVLYPYINTDIPARDEVEYLTDGGFMFLRLSPEGVEAPHQAHNDSSMADNTLLIYLCEGPGGTSLVRHKETGLYKQPETEEELAIWQRDYNIYDAWEVTHMFDLIPNRAVSFPSTLMHRAEPVNGFGKTAEDGRLVLTCFYD